MTANSVGPPNPLLQPPSFEGVNNNEINTLGQCSTDLDNAVNDQLEARVRSVFEDSAFLDLDEMKTQLTNKYYKYNKAYQSLLQQKEAGTLKELWDPKASPQLLDALLTGCGLPFAVSTFDVFNTGIEKDIRFMVQSMPKSMNCRMGSLRCRMHVTPLHAAVINMNIPPRIIEYLLQNGADANETFLFNNQLVKVYDDIPQRASEIEEIQALFVKYGYDELVMPASPEPATSAPPLEWSDLPTELRHEVVKHLVPGINATPEELIEAARTLTNASLANKDLKFMCDDVKPALVELVELMKTQLTNKYCKYNNEYQSLLQEKEAGTLKELWDPKASPQLLDALFSGCRLPSAESTFDFFDRGTEKDIEFMLKFMFSSTINCRMGKLRCRMHVTPLHAAVINMNVPIHIIEKLLRNGADANATFFNNQRVKIYHDIPERVREIEQFQTISKYYDIPEQVCEMRKIQVLDEIEKIQALFVKYGYTDP